MSRLVVDRQSSRHHVNEDPFLFNLMKDRIVHVPRRPDELRTEEGSGPTARNEAVPVAAGRARIERGHRGE